MTDDSETRGLQAGQSRIEAGLIALTETVNRKFDELGQKYVPREELNSRFGGITEHQLRQDERLTGLEGGREIDRTSLEARADRVEERIRVDRFNAKIVATGMFTALVAVGSVVVTHWH